MKKIYFEITKSSLEEAKWFYFSRVSLWRLFFASLLMGTGIYLLTDISLPLCAGVFFLFSTFLWWVSVIKFGVSKQYNTLKANNRTKGFIQIQDPMIVVQLGNDSFEVKKYNTFMAKDDVYFCFKLGKWKKFLVSIPKGALSAQ
ncbi:MAG: hypothetical protein CME60_04805 [Halobacteriovoraceae bacterium]|nr:hypothetical protein [Halobacteriovoraceae bacterium]